MGFWIIPNKAYLQRMLFVKAFSFFGRNRVPYFYINRAFNFYMSGSLCSAAAPRGRCGRWPATLQTGKKSQAYGGGDLSQKMGFFFALSF